MTTRFPNWASDRRSQAPRRPSPASRRWARRMCRSFPAHQC